MIKHIAICLMVLMMSVAVAGCDTSTGDTKDNAKKPAAKVSQKTKSAKKGDVTITLSEADKNYLMGVARKTFDLYVKEKKRFEPKDVPAHLADMPSNLVFATIYMLGDWRGCVSATGKNIVDATIGSVINTIRDRRFRDPTEAEIADFRVELSYLQPFELIETKDPEQVKKELEPGVHGISIRHDSGKRAFFLPYVFVKKQRTTITWLERICQKARLPKDAWKDPATKIYRYGTVNFIESEPYGKPVDLYRYKVELDAVKPTDLDAAVKLSMAFLLDQQSGGTGQLAPGYDENHKPIKRTNPIAQMIGLVAFGFATDANVYPSRLPNATSKLYGSLGDKLVSDDKGMHVDLAPQDEPLATLLFTEAVLLDESYKDRKKALKALARYLRGYLGKDGGLPGENHLMPDAATYALYVMAKLAKVTEDAEDKALALKLFDANWKPGRAWSLKTMAEILPLMQGEELEKKLIAALEADLQEQYTEKTAPYSDYIGAYRSEEAPQTIDVAVHLRGLVAAYRQISPENGKAREDALRASLFAIRWLLEQQFTSESAFYFKEWKELRGAFKKDILLNTTRLNDTGLALISLLDASTALGEAFDVAITRYSEELVK